MTHSLCLPCRFAHRRWLHHRRVNFVLRPLHLPWHSYATCHYYTKTVPAQAAIPHDGLDVNSSYRVFAVEQLAPVGDRRSRLAVTRRV